MVPMATNCLATKNTVKPGEVGREVGREERERRIMTSKREEVEFEEEAIN